MDHKVFEPFDIKRRLFFDMLDTLPAMICLLRSDYQFVFINCSFHEKFGDAIGQRCYEFCFGRTSPYELCKAYKVIETGQRQHWEAEGPDGSVLHVYAFPFTDIDGLPMILEMKIDITEQKKAEELLAKMEIVRKQEIHHRIRNNLQIIFSLLDLQAEKFNNRGYIKDSEVLEIFRMSQDRIMSMALIHEELYKSGRLDKLDFSSYIKKLIDNPFLTYRLENENISVNMNIEENLFFDINTVIPLGMIINELVFNSLKHAFQGREEGEIRIKLYRKRFVEFENKDFKSTSLVLIISDNGMGTHELNFEDLNTLGMQLVTSLVNQLDGELELKRDKRTEFTMQFTLTEKNKFI
jgi:two-component sensor histidine kinase